MPIPAQHDEASDNWTCSICLNIPLRPVLLPCEHLFCAECVDQLPSLDEYDSRRSLRCKQCPNCRKQLCLSNSGQNIAPGSFLYRLWSGIKVKCDNQGCGWIGPVSIYKSHLDACEQGGNEGHKRDRLTIAALKGQVTALKNENKKLVEAMAALKTAYEDEASRMARVSSAEIKRLGNLLELHASGEFDFDKDYQYTRDNVGNLSQLIARHLCYIPHFVDVNRIYNCVRNCFLDLHRSDNPEYYYQDVRMLLTTCAASCWFSDRQQDNIRRWLLAEKWNGAITF